MGNKVEVIRKTNDAFVKMMEELSVDQLNFIPDGFNNNIIWNYAHLLSMQQEYFYGLSGLPYTVDKAFIDHYKKGTKPDEFLSQTEIQNLVEKFRQTIEQLEKDYHAGLFKNYKSYTTSIGFTIENIEDAFQISAFHDGWHFGVARTLKKLV